MNGFVHFDPDNIVAPIYYAEKPSQEPEIV